jgi:hypothetical protein
MKITERRLRSIIRQVIKESKLNEMMGDMHHFDTFAGASGHSESAPLLASKFNNISQIMDTTDFFQASIMMGSLIKFIRSDLMSKEQLISLGICVGTMLWISIREYLANIDCTRDEKRELMTMQKEIEDQCPECVEEVKEMNL